MIPSNTNCISLHLSASSAHHGSGGSERTSGPIRCQRCREVCKGEVVRVQDTHFHVKCFTCAGKTCKHDPDRVLLVISNKVWQDLFEYVQCKCLALSLPSLTLADTQFILFLLHMLRATISLWWGLERIRAALQGT